MTKNCDIIGILVDIITSNIDHSPSIKYKNMQIMPVLSIYSDGKPQKFHEPEIEIDDEEKHKSDKSQRVETMEEKDNILSPSQITERSNIKTPNIMKSDESERTEIMEKNNDTLSPQIAT